MKEKASERAREFRDTLERETKRIRRDNNQWLFQSIPESQRNTLSFGKEQEITRFLINPPRTPSTPSLKGQLKGKVKSTSSSLKVNKITKYLTSYNNAGTDRGGERELEAVPDHPKEPRLAMKDTETTLPTSRPMGSTNVIYVSSQEQILCANPQVKLKWPREGEERAAEPARESPKPAPTPLRGHQVDQTVPGGGESEEIPGAPEQDPDQAEGGDVSQFNRELPTGRQSLQTLGLAVDGPLNQTIENHVNTDEDIAKDDLSVSLDSVDWNLIIAEFERPMNDQLHPKEGEGVFVESKDEKKPTTRNKHRSLKCHDPDERGLGRAKLKVKLKPRNPITLRASKESTAKMRLLTTWTRNKSSSSTLQPNVRQLLKQPPQIHSTRGGRSTSPEGNIYTCQLGSLSFRLDGEDDRRDSSRESDHP